LITPPDLKTGRREREENGMGGTPAESRQFDRLTREVVEFRDERDWAQFHHPKDLAVSVALEAAELLEMFQWKTREEVRALVEDPEFRHRAGEEMADVLILLLSTADVVGVDLYEATLGKLRKNARKYPVEKAKGNARKYDQLP
jgi:NTP pyrophosphatase (non-canonical NTP hydrolase)